MTTLLLVSAAGGLGAVLRFVLDGVVRGVTGGGYPWGTGLINLTGSLLLGLVTGLALAHLVPEPWHLALGTGFLGGYTTFSTASVEVVLLFQDRRRLAALVYAVGLPVASVALAAVGLALGLAA